MSKDKPIGFTRAGDAMTVRPGEAVRYHNEPIVDARKAGSFKVTMMTPVEVAANNRCAWINSLLALQDAPDKADKETVIKEVVQMLIDLLDVFEQGPHEDKAIAALDAWAEKST